MTRRQPAIALILLFLLTPLLSAQTLNGASPTLPVRRILILNEQNPYYPAIGMIDEALRETLQSSKYRVQIYREYMDANLFPEASDQKLFEDFYIRKYQDRKPDVIVTVGSTPLKLARELHRTVFAGIPVIYCLPGTEEQVETDPDFTGITTGIEAKATLDAALRLLPTTKHVLVVGGLALFDLVQFEDVKSQLDPYNGELDISYVNNLPIPQLRERLKNLPNGYIVIFVSISRDAANTRLSSRETGPLIASASSAPVFSLFDVYIGHGEVGGKLSSIRTQGAIAGEMILKILNGAKISDIPVEKAPGQFVFDWNALRRWGIKESNLPPGSTVINRTLTPWEEFRWYIVSGVALILLEGVLISGLMWQRTTRRKAEQRLRESEQRFRVLADTAPVLIWTSGVDGKCEYFNKPWLTFTGRRLEEEQGDGWAQGVHPDDQKFCMGTYRAAFDVRQPFEMQYRLRNYDGEYRWVFDRGVPRLSPDGTFAGYIGSCIDITERKLAEDALTNLSGRLIAAQEEERSRIAREIHDDYQQRLAMFTNDLDSLREDSSSEEMKAELRRLWNDASELASDMHSLSHRLHSSTLETLGLAAGIEAFCNEFQVQHGVQVTFAHDNVPRGIPSDAALCLFRVAQESLRNIKRHSGADHAHVRLVWTGEKLQLTVSDEGTGFDARFRLPNAGIGIRSMEERLRLVGGYLEVDSKPGHGTIINAWVPFEVTRQTAS